MIRINDLVIIGNGFDLAHGLKTKYSDFILNYIQDVYLKLVDGREHNDALLGVKSIIRGQFPFSEIGSIDGFITTLKDYNIKLSYKTPYFRDILTNDARWMDIEYLYYQHLLNLYRRLEDQNLDHDDELLKQVTRLNSSLELIKNKFVEYLKRCLEDEYPNTRPSLQKHFSSIYKNSNSIKVLNFNYTKTPKLYLEKETSMVYIHGSIHNEKDEIIFGYGDEMDVYYPKLERLNQNEFIKNFKSHGYFSNNRYNDITSFIGAGSYRVHIMGHSCGLSDRVLLNRIFDNLNCNEIIIYYHTTEDLKTKSIDLSRHFKPESKHKMRTLLNYDKCKPLVNLG